MSYILNCLVLGDNPFENIFQLALDTSEIQTIGLLKNAIIMSQNLNVATKDVKLWKVNFPLIGFNEVEKLEMINKCTNVNVDIREELGGVELPTISMSSNEFTIQQDLQHAHVIIQLSTSPIYYLQKRSASPSVEQKEYKKQKFIDLEEFSNICDLVKHMRSASTSCHSFKYNIIIKHPQNKPLAVVEKPAIYVRESYVDLYHLLIEKASKGSKHKFLITGTSGIGKSCFLIYLLIQLLCEYKNSTIIFQPLQSKVFYCFKDLKLSIGNYEDFSTYLKSPETWYLADGIISPKLVKAKTVVALSPKGTVKDEFQEFDKKVVKRFYLSPWTLEELSFCQKYIFPDVPEDIMQDLYYKAGGVPRYVFQRVESSLQYGSPKTPEGKEAIIEEAFYRVRQALLQINNFNDLISCFTDDAYYIQYSSRLVHRWPNPSYDCYHLQWASRYIYNEIEKKLEKQAWSSLLRQIQAMKDYPSARGIMFELYVIHLFRSGNNQFVMRELLESSKTKTTPNHMNFSFSTGKSPTVGNIRISKELSSKGDNIIILPDTSNFGAADLFYTPNMIFQVTVSNNHPIKQAELVEIVENMPAYGKDPIYFVFVVPDDIYDSYKYQDIVTRDTNSKTFRKVKTQNVKLKNVQQWVLKIDMNMSG